MGIRLKSDGRGGFYEAGTPLLEIVLVFGLFCAVAAVGLSIIAIGFWLVCLIRKPGPNLMLTAFFYLVTRIG